MPFEAGTLSVAMCHLPQELPHDALERFVAHKAGPLANVAEEIQVGWVGWRHLLDTAITESNAYVGGYLHLVLRTAQRRIPPSLLKAECRVEELALMQANQQRMVTRKQKQQIKQDVSERLIKQMPPTLGGTAFVLDPATRMLYVGAGSPSKLDAFLGTFTNTLEIDPVPLAPEAAAQALFKVDPTDVPPLDFSTHGRSSELFLGRDFATWLWFFQEEEGGTFQVERQGTCAVAIDGPLVFVGESSNALESVARKGTPTASAEAKAALTVGKKLKQAKFTLARGNEAWTFTLDADTFFFRGMTLPAGEELDMMSHFQERIMLLHDFRTAFFALFKRYLDQVMDDDGLARLQRRVQQWVENKRSQ
jgi:hypothetical protein